MKEVTISTRGWYASLVLAGLAKPTVTPQERKNLAKKAVAYAIDLEEALLESFNQEQGKSQEDQLG